MKNKFRKVSAGLIVGLLTSLVLPAIANAHKYSGPTTPLPPAPTYKRIILKPYLGKVTLQRSFQPDVTTSAIFSSGCSTTYIPNNTSWSSLVANVTNDLSTGFAPGFTITKVPALAVALPAECKVLISNATTYDTYVYGTDQYKFTVKGKFVNPNISGETAVLDSNFNQKVVNPTTGNTNPQEVERNAADYNFKKYEAKAINRVNTSEISGGGLAAGVNSTEISGGGMAAGIDSTSEGEIKYDYKRQER